MVDKNRKMRQDILEILYNEAIKGKEVYSKLDLKDELAKIGSDISCFPFNLRWLAEKGYIDGGPLTLSIRIAVKGIDFIEERRDFSNTNIPKREQLPSSAPIKVVKNKGIINVVTGNGNILMINQQITDAFKKAYSLVEDNSEIRYATKSQVMERLSEIEEELRKKNNAHKGKLEAGLEWLKEHTFEIASIVEPLVLKALGA